MNSNQIKLLLGALGLGVLVSVIKNTPAKAASNSLPDDGQSQSTASGSSSPTSGSSGSTTVNTAERRIFLVSNSNYNRLYKSVGDTLNAQGNYGREPIINMEIPYYVGSATAERKNGLVRVYMRIDGIGYYGWVIENKCNAHTEAELAEMLRTGRAKYKTSFMLGEITKNLR